MKLINVIFLLFYQRKWENKYFNITGAKGLMTFISPGSRYVNLKKYLIHKTLNLQTFRDSSTGTKKKNIYI